MINKDKFLDFEAASKEDWKALVIKELKGKPYESLVWDTGEGFSMDPLFTKEEVNSDVNVFPENRGAFNYDNSWTILQEYSQSELKTCNENIIEGLTSGVQGIVISELEKESDYASLLKDVFIDWIKILLKTDDGEKDLNLFLKFAESKGVNKKDIRGGLFFDPLNKLLIEGNWHKSQQEDFTSIVDTVRTGSLLINYKTITVNGNIYGDCGSTAVNELAYSLACYHDYLIMLLENGISEEVVAESIQVNLSIGRSFFMEIAKIKAFRILHAQLLKSYDLKAKEINIVSKSSMFELAPTDKYTNLLRTTTQAMAAGIGGANDVLLGTFDGEQNPFSQRMSTNTQLLLIEESFLSKSKDVSAGSYAVEKMVVELAKNAWKKFQEIEDGGGWMKSVESGQLQNDMMQDAKSKIDAINTKDRKWLGVNEYKNSKEKTWTSSEIVSEENIDNAFRKLHKIQHNF